MGKKFLPWRKLFPLYYTRGRGIFIEIKEPGSEKIVSEVLSNFQNRKDHMRFVSFREPGSNENLSSGFKNRDYRIE